MSLLKGCLAGIDFSLFSTGLTILKDNKYEFYYFPNSKPRNSSQLSSIFIYVERKEKQKNFLRYAELAELILQVLKEHKVEKVYIEDYALVKVDGYKINLIEATSVLKYLLLVNGIEVDKISPTQVKKAATDNGSSGKDELLETFIAEYPDFSSIRLLNKYAYDIVDSYYTLKAGLHYKGGA